MAYRARELALGAIGTAALGITLCLVLVGDFAGRRVDVPHDVAVVQVALARSGARPPIPSIELWRRAARGTVL